MGKPCNRSNADNSQPTQIHCTEPVEASGPIGQAVSFLRFVEIAQEWILRSAPVLVAVEPATSLILSSHLNCSCACSLGVSARHDLQGPMGAMFDALRLFTLALIFGWCSKSELNRIAAVSTQFWCEPLFQMASRWLPDL